MLKNIIISIFDLVLLFRNSLDTLATYDSVRSSQKPVQFKGNKTVWLLCQVKIPVVSTAKTFKRKSKKSFTKKDYIFIINSAKDIDDVDSEFLYAVQKFATMILQNMETRKHKADIKNDCLNSIKDTCESWKSFLHNRDAFFSEVCESIGTCYLSANLYVGKLLQSANSIEYVLASQFSEMKGKCLHRDPPRGLSFNAVDSFNHIAVTKSDSALCDKLCYFGAREGLEFPYLAVPLATFQDSPLGILAADGMEDITQDESGSPNEAISFLFAVASHLSLPMKHFFLEDIAQQLASIELQCSSFEEAFIRLKSEILSLLPYSKDLSYICFNARRTDMEASTAAPSLQLPTRIGLVYIMQIVEAKCLIDFVTKPSIKVQWKNSTLLAMECHFITTDENEPALCIVKIPEGTNFEDIDLRIYLHGTLDGKKRELSKRSIGLQQMSNDGAQLIDYNMECQYAPLPYVHAGRLKFVGRMYSDSDIVRIVFRQIACIELICLLGKDAKKDIDPYIIMRWKGIEIGRTDVLKKNANPVWKHLDIFVKPSYDDVMSPELSLSIEVWDTDALDRGSCLGLQRFSISMLVNNISSKSVPLENEIQQGTSVGSVRMVTDVLYASHMDEEIALEALKIPFLSTTIHDSGGENLDESDDVAELALKNRKCELTLCSVNIARTMSYSPDATDVMMLGMKPYCIVFFNGAEIGRTGSASPAEPNPALTNYDHGDNVMEVRHWTSFSWDSETLLLEINADVNIDVCKLLVELWIFDEAEKGVKLGTLTVEEKSFGSLLCTSLRVCRWYDVQSFGKDDDACGEILLTGRPLDVATESANCSTKPVNVQALSININELFVKYASVEDEKKEHFLTIKFNDAVVLSCDISDVKSGEMSQILCTSNFAKPCDRSLYDSTMKFELFESSKAKPVVRAVLGKQQLVHLIGQNMQRSTRIELVHEKSTCEGNATTLARVNVAGGPINTDIMVEYDGRRIGVDVLGATGLIAPPYYNLRRPNCFCKVYWNDELVGQTSIFWNASDPLWNTHRFYLPVPLVEKFDDDLILSLCSLKVEVWSVLSLSERSEELLGCIEVKEDSLISKFKSKCATVTWLPVEMSSSYPLEKQEFVCSKKGAIKLRIFREGCTSDEADDKFELRGGEFLLKIHEAKDLTEIDHFTKTNAKVIIYWNNVEVGRTVVIPSETNPVWENEVFLLRAAPGESLLDQSLQIHVYDTTGGITGDFLGCIEVAADRIVDFFSRDILNLQRFDLKESLEMDDSDNRHVAGEICVSAEIVKVQPVGAPVQLYSKASLFIKGALNLKSSNIFQRSSDAMCIVYWSSTFDQKFDIEIGRSKVAWKSLNPIWQKEKILVDVPVIDEWTSISVRIEVRDVASYGDSTFLGSVVLSGGSLKSLLNRPEEESAILMQYSLRLQSPLMLPEFSSYWLEKLDNEESNEVNSSFLVLAGGASDSLEIDEEKEHHDFFEGDKGEAEAKGLKEERGGLFKGLKKSLSVISMKDRLRKRETKAVEFRIHEVNCLCLPDSFLIGGGIDVSKRLYFLITFNDVENRVGPVKGSETMSTSLRVQFNSDPLMTSFSRPQEEDLTTCTTQFDLWVTADTTATATENENGMSPGDYFLGTLLLHGKDIVSLMRPKAPSKTFSLKNKKNIELSQNKYVVGSAIVVSGSMPNLLRQLSGDSMGSTVRRSASSTRLAAPDEEEELLNEEKVEIHICEATGLFKSTSMMGSLHDYRADIYWNDELKHSTHFIKAVPGTTSLSVDVVWENEYFIIVKPQGEVLLDCKLTVEIVSKSSSWGAVNLEGEALLDFFENLEPDLHDLTALHQKSNQKNIQGKLYFEAKVLPQSSNTGDTDETSNDLHEFDTSKQLPEGMKDLHFYVLAARDLGQADKFGKSDPFCVVKWNGVEIGKTDVKKKTLNPVWEEGHFLLRTYANLGPKDDQDKLLISSYCAYDSLKLGSGIGGAVAQAGGRRRQVVPIAAVSKSTFQPRTNCVLTIEVWDWNAMGNSVFLGVCELKGSSLASFFDCKHTKRNWYKLEKNKKLSRSANKLVRGALEISVGPVDSAIEASSDPYCLEVEISAGKNLNRVDIYSQADPYCVIRWNQEICGKTHVLKNTLDPEWENEVFNLDFQEPKNVDEGYLYIELWDFDVGVQDKFLGSTLVKGRKLRRLIEKGDFKWFDLGKSIFVTPSLQNMEIGGAIRIRVGPVDPNKRKLSDKKTTSFEISIVGAEKLSNSAFFGNVDSFCILKQNGREIGTSSTIAENSCPVWNEKFPLVLDTYVNQYDEVCSDDNVSIEVWSTLALARGEFLGLVNLTIADLLELSVNCKSVKESDRVKLNFRLQKIPTLPENGQTHIQGSLRLHAKHFGAVDMKELGAAAAAETRVQWPVRAPLVPGTTHGLPSFEITILSITDLVVPTKSRSTVIPDPFCLVFFNGQEVGTTPVCSSTVNPVWKNPESISIKIPENVESESYWVTIKVYNMLSLDRGEFLGQVSFSFWSLFCLHYGSFTLQLGPEIGNTDQVIKAKINLSVDIYSPLWDSVRCFSSPSIQRTLTVLHAQGLPKVNNALPSTKCVVFYDGGIKVRTPLVLESIHPVWSPLPTLEVLLDYRDPKDIVIQIIYVDVAEKKEFCLGEVSLPFEFIVRPPSEPIELWLVEPFKSAPKGYSFLLDGSVTIQIHATNEISAWKPWSERLTKPLVNYSVEEIKNVGVANNKSKNEPPATFSPEELRWIGSAGSFTSPSIIPAKPDVMLIPIKGMGAIVDGRCIGNDPQKQYALAVKRGGHEKFPVSDTMMIQDSLIVIQKCVTQLRRKELYTHIRDSSLNKLRVYFDNMIRKNRFDLSAIFKRVSSVISTCFPGTVSFIALSSKDSKSMRYTLFEKSFEKEDSPSFFTLWEGEGIEWNCVGRHAGKGSTVSSKELSGAHTYGKPIAFSRFRQFRPPRICSPLSCGDVSLGVVGIENFDVYRAGMNENFSDMPSVQRWLDSIGNLCGKILYTGREKNVIKLLESYSLLSMSSVNGLLKVLLENCLQVLQGCRLMEIWSLHDRSLTSLATSWPESIPAPKKWISIQNIKVHFAKAGALKADIKNVGKKIGNFLFGAKDNDNAVKDSDVNAIDSDDGQLQSHKLLKPCGYVLGIYYGGFERYQFAEYFTTSKDKLEDFEHWFEDTKIFISNERDIWLSLYAIDTDLSILEQWSGKFQIVNFKEKKISASLQNDNLKGKGHFSFTSSLQWPSATSAAMQRAVEMKALEAVKKFSVTVHQARGLQKTDLVGSADPFCEIYWQNELVGKTRVLKDTLEPVWEESFDMEPSGDIKSGGVISCRVEVWDMDFLGKGSFMGEFCIPLDQLLEPPTSEIEVTLESRSSYNKSDNKFVGGTLVLSHTVLKVVSDDAEKNDELMDDSASDSDDSDDEVKKSPAVYELSKVEKQRVRRLLEIEDPVLKLNVGKAVGLAKADLLGLANSYVKIFRYSTVEFNASKRSVSGKDPLAATRVIERSLNPTWNDELVLGVNVRSHLGDDGKESAGGLLDEWPIFVLEVWSKVKVGDGAFLGMLSIDPTQYALKASMSGDLMPSPTLDTKGNKFVQGSIFLDFKVEGQESKSLSSSYVLSPSNHLMPATHATLTIVSAKVDGVIKGGLRKKTVNPYCVVRWGEVKIGQTATKNNSMEPSWANEKFSLDLTQALLKPHWLGVTIEIWNRQADEAVLFGEVTISLIELLHPSLGEIITRNLRKSSVDTDKDKDQVVKGSLNFKISKYRFPQKISPLLKYVHCYPLELKNFDKNKSDPILKHYGQENPRVLLTNPVKLEVIRDTEEEMRRQGNENVNLPGVIRHIEELNNKYNTAIFDQVGLISEVHFGQTLSAFQREAPTVLHVGDCDCFLLPTIIKRPEYSARKSDSITDFDGKSIPLPIKKSSVKKKKGKIDVGDGDLCLVSRYMKERIPQRDIQFLKKMRDIISKSIVLFEQRHRRRIERQGIVQKLKNMCTDINRYSPEDVAMISIADLHLHFDCKVDVYLLRRNKSCHQFVRCCPENGVVEPQDSGGWETNNFVSTSAKLCRHGLLLQFYRGNQAVASTSWKHGFSEASVLPLQSLREDIRAVESKKILGQIVNLSQQSFPMGGCLIPLMVQDEYLVGMLSISGTDKIPHSIYRLLKNEHTKVEGLEMSADDDIETHQMFEEGTSACMRDVGLHLGHALFSARLVGALREVKTFPIREGVDTEDLIRFCFRKLLESVPIICEISVWRVLICREEHNLSSVPIEEMDSLIVAGFFESKGVASLLSTPNEKDVYQSYHAALSSTTTIESDIHPPSSSGTSPELDTAKKIYAACAPWTVGIPSTLTDDIEIIRSSSFEPGKRSDDNIDSASSESNSESSDSGSDDNDAESNSSTGNNRNEEDKISELNSTKSFFGGFFGATKKDAKVSTGPSLNVAIATPTGIDKLEDTLARTSLGDRVERAHTEINRCVTKLTQSSFRINCCGGVYLSSISNRGNDDVISRVFKQKFDKSNSYLKEEYSVGGNNSTNGKTKKKLLIPGTRGVKTNERLIHISESDSVPPNLVNAPLPKGKVKPTGKTVVNKKNTAIRDKKSSNDAGIAGSSLGAAGPRYEYFLAVRDCGLGGDDGWGTVGAEVSTAVDGMVESMSDILAKHLSQKVKKPTTKK